MPPHRRKYEGSLFGSCCATAGSAWINWARKRGSESNCVALLHAELEALIGFLHLRSKSAARRDGSIAA